MSRPGTSRISALEPRAGRPNAAKKKITVSGALRKSVTYAVPIQRSGGTGEIRRTATRVPRMRAPIADRMHNWRVSQNPSRNVPMLSISVCTGAPTLLARQPRGILDSGARSRAYRSPRSPRVSVAVNSRRRGQVRVELAGGVFPRLLVAAVAEGLLQHVVNEVAELGVVLLDPDAVGLVGELRPGQLELSFALGHVAEQDHIVGGDGV